MPDATTLSAALAWSRDRIGPVDARSLLCHVAGCNPATLVAFGERELAPEARIRFESLVARREEGVPVAYLTGEREFYSRRFKVGQGVLIPRPETELLVELALAKVSGRGALRVLDLGTGSGILAITLALELADRTASVTGVDASSVALGYAAWNAGALGAAVEWRQGNWFAGLGDMCFDLVVANPPYVRDADEHLEQGDLRFEPRAALAAGGDGLADIRRIVAEGRSHLASGAWLLIEHGYDQADEVRALMEVAGFADIGSARDLAGIERVTAGRWFRAGLTR